MRGRPPKVADEDLNLNEVETFSEVLHKWCSMKGCLPKYHAEEASDIILALKRRGYRIEKHD